MTKTTHHRRPQGDPSRTAAARAHSIQMRQARRLKWQGQGR